MRILLTNHWLKKAGGSETWTFTMAENLKKLGHQVEVFTNIPGIISNRIKHDLKIPIRMDPNTLKPYDLILANHSTCVKKLRGRKLGKMIQTCHGTIPKLEQPTMGADLHVGISLEVEKHIQDSGFTCAGVIHNGIDLERFKITRPLNDTPKFALSLAHSDEGNRMIQRACDLHGISLRILNKHKNPIWAVEKVINEVDLVFSLGRGTYESLACGRAVIIFDKRPYQEALGDGYLTLDRWEEFLSHNCSGRATRKKFTPKTLADEIAKYDKNHQITNRMIAQRYLDVNLAIYKYLELS